MPDVASTDRLTCGPSMHTQMVIENLFRTCSCFPSHCCQIASHNALQISGIHCFLEYFASLPILVRFISNRDPSAAGVREVEMRTTRLPITPKYAPLL